MSNDINKAVKDLIKALEVGTYSNERQNLCELLYKLGIKSAKHHGIRFGEALGIESIYAITKRLKFDLK